VCMCVCVCVCVFFSLQIYTAAGSALSCVEFGDVWAWLEAVNHSPTSLGSSG